MPTNEPALDRALIDATFGAICDRHEDKVDLPAYTPEEEVIVLVWHVFGLVGVNGIAGLFTDVIDGDPGYQRSAAAFRKIDARIAAFAFQELLDLFEKTDLRKPLPKRAVEFQDRFQRWSRCWKMRLWTPKPK
jgi:hypothetical protein